VRVKLGDHFTKFLSDQQRRGECHKRSPFGRPGFRVAGVPAKAAEFEVRLGSHGAADPIEGGILGTDEVRVGIDRLELPPSLSLARTTDSKA
jgi:hypothetical protein